MIDHKSNMKAVLESANNNIKLDESPFAAGILCDDIFLICNNLSRSSGNPNMHAEIVCINRFCELYGADKLRDAILYSSCEPCLMCLHSIENAGIPYIFFAASIDDAIKYGSGDISNHTIEYVKKMGLHVSINGGLMRNEMCAIYEQCIRIRGEL